MTDTFQNLQPKPKGITCRKCGHVRTKGEPGHPLQCPGCGAFYHKVAEQAAAGVEIRAAGPQVSPPAPIAPPAPARSPANDKTVMCTDCDGTVSRRAETCPHCGAPMSATPQAAPPPLEYVKKLPPMPPPKSSGIKIGRANLGFIVMGVLLVIGVTLNDGSGTSTSKPSARACGPEQKECYYKRNLMAAQRACRPKIEDQARYQAEWTYSLDGMFESYAVSNDGTILFLGNEVKFQNGFGAWSKQTYRCIYDPAHDSAIATVSG